MMKTNIEYWKGKIRDLEGKGYNIAIINDEPERCESSSCQDCIMNCGDNCSLLAAFEWGEQEHKEAPLLSGDEAELIRSVIKRSAFNVKTIIRTARNDSIHSGRLAFKCEVVQVDQLSVSIGTCCIMNIKPNVFTAMELDKQYTVEELIGHQDQ